MIEVTYTSNNSGGRDWLSAKDWDALKEAGWKQDSYSCVTKSFETPREALQEFEKLTDQDVTDEGCNCCGAPHTFTWRTETGSRYVAGLDCVEILYDKAPTYREALDLLNKE